MAGEGFLVGPFLLLEKTRLLKTRKPPKCLLTFLLFREAMDFNGFYWIFGALGPFFMTQAQVADWGEHPDDVECADPVDHDG